MVHFKSVLTFAAVVCCWSPLRAVAQCTFAGLGDLPGGTFRSNAFDVSADGSVVVGDSLSEPGWEAFRWTDEEGMVGLGDLPGGLFASMATGVSADGSVIVGRGRPEGGLVYEACRWTAEGGIEGLGFLPKSGPSSMAFGVSDDGQVIIGRAELEPFGYEVAFRWTAAEGMVSLGFLESGVPTRGAWGVSADGSVIMGSAFIPNTSQEAFRWTPETGSVGLGFLPGGTGSASSVVTPDGVIAFGGSGSDEGPQLWRWTEQEGMIGLGVPMFDKDVTADGTIVVGADIDWQGATIWDAENGMRWLHDVLVTDYGMDLSGWVFGDARGISADGSTIVGRGVNPDGLIEGWIARLPRPGSGDYNMDQQVDEHDSDGFQECFSGPDVPFGTCCIFADFDDDGDVDCDDWALFLEAWTAAGAPPCLPACDCDPADFNADGSVNAFDLAFLLGSWGPCSDPDDCHADLDGDGSVGAADLAILLGSWG